MLLKMKMTVKFLRNGEEEGDPAKSWTHQVTVLEVRCLSSSVRTRVAEFGSLSSMAKMAMKIFVKRVFTIVATNALFLRIIANLKFNSVRYAIYTMK